MNKELPPMNGFDTYDKLSVSKLAAHRYKIFVTGLVQGVGVRPYIYRLAKRFGITGVVFNHEGGVIIEAEGEEDNLKSFYASIPKEFPIQGKIETIYFDSKEPLGYKDFSIKVSSDGIMGNFIIPPDFSICESCKKEILDKSNRRYYYPFTACTDCGPRFTIIQKFPYDRTNTVMNSFQLCESCATDYNNPEDRRFHAELIACSDCGPRVTVYDSARKANLEFAKSEELFSFLQNSLKDGNILAIKSIGGFHLACEATNISALKMLRLRKKRKTKPFAVMFPDLESISQVAFVSEKEKELLVSSGSPIVLLSKRSIQLFPTEVDGRSPYIGAFLPYTPLHVLLFAGYDAPLVMTSANSSDEPVLIDNAEAVSALQSIADYIILHDRPILLPCDDSVVKVANDKREFIRRGRGFSPYILKSKKEMTPMVSFGADSKNTISISYENNIITSQHIGNLRSPASLESYSNVITHYNSIYHLNHRNIASDLHPGYYSTKKAKEFSGVDTLISIQHHHSHIASCIAENEHEGAVVGLAMDGTGYGDDDSIWGGEFLICDKRNYKRVGHLFPLPLPGGEIAIKEVWRLGLSALLESGVSLEVIHRLDFLKDYPNWEKIKLLSENKINSPITTGCGRLFDAVSAILGICTVADYDAEAATKLENQIYLEDLQNEKILDFYKIKNLENTNFVLDWRNMIREIAQDVISGVSSGKISLKFHLGLIHAMAECSIRIANKYAIDTIALSGGCFHNSYLKENLISLLEDKGKKVIYHSELPSGDGGISFGQMIIANSILSGEKSCVSQYQ